MLDTLEHTTRETIRTNTITVYKTLAIQLQEANLKYDHVLDRINTLGIVLGED